MLYILSAKDPDGADIPRWRGYIPDGADISTSDIAELHSVTTIKIKL